MAMIQKGILCKAHLYIQFHLHSSIDNIQYKLKEYKKPPLTKLLLIQNNILDCHTITLFYHNYNKKYTYFFSLQVLGNISFNLVTIFNYPRF